MLVSMLAKHKHSRSVTFRTKVHPAGEERNVGDVRLNIGVVKDIAVAIQASQA